MKHSIKTFFLSCFIMFFAFAPLLAFAQTDPTADASGSKLKDLTVKLQIPLPFVETKCETKDINGKTVPSVCDLSDYIAGVYRLLIGAGALFAVVMIIIGGYQWMLSGGSADKTGAAKKRIFGAIIGLMLALLSYIILNTITPRLVSLRLPKVEPVAKYDFKVGETCNDSSRLKQYEDNGLALQVQEQIVQLSSLPGVSTIMKNRSEAKCGTKYDVYSVDVSPLLTKKPPQKIDTCAGGSCVGYAAGTSCIAGKCIPGLMYGTISWSPDNGYVDYLRLHPICNESSWLEGNTTVVGNAVSALDVVEKGSYYILKSDSITDTNEYIGVEAKSSLELATKQCANGFKGFVLKAEVNNDCWGWSDFALDSDYAIGRSCNKPLTSITSAGKTQYKFGSIDWNQVKEEDLFQLSDFDGKAFKCDLVIDRSRFPVVKQLTKDPPAKCPWYEL